MGSPDLPAKGKQKMMRGRHYIPPVASAPSGAPHKVTLMLHSTSLSYDLDVLSFTLPFAHLPPKEKFGEYANSLSRATPGQRFKTCDPFALLTLRVLILEGLDNQRFVVINVDERCQTSTTTLDQNGSNLNPAFQDDLSEQELNIRRRYIPLPPRAPHDA